MHLNSIYRLTDGVQVRNEKFGLLFYDYRGPRLYFVPSKSLIRDTFFDGRQTLENLLNQQCEDQQPCSRDQIRDQLKQVLETLEGKGLIHGQPIC